MDDAIIGVHLTRKEWVGIIGYMLTAGVSRHNDTIKSIIGQVEYAGNNPVPDTTMQPRDEEGVT